MKFFLVIDFETSGLPHEGAQPIELGAVLLDPKSLEMVSEFHALIRHDPDKFTWSEEAEATHGIDRADTVQFGFHMEEAFEKFLDWLSGFVNLEATGEVMLAGHSIPFDLQFLSILAGIDPSLGAAPLPPWACYTVRDTLQWAALVNQASIDAHGFRAAPFKDPETGNPSVALENVAAGLGIPTPGSHGALEDARTTAAVMRSLLSNLAGDLSNSRKYEARKAHIEAGRKK